MGHSSQDATFQTLNIQVFVYWTGETIVSEPKDYILSSISRNEIWCTAPVNDLDILALTLPVWLINVYTLRLEEFWSEKEKKYAILSHRWEADEVSFKDVQDLKTASKKRSFAKIEKSCELARSNDLDYMWVDTGCINKESSAELTEAINSMFRWYKSADVCYTFLSDIDISASDEATIEHQMVKSV
ncbi:MAG: hypothetical protein Q9200_000759 [Gallowayella weberi]